MRTLPIWLMFSILFLSANVSAITCNAIPGDLDPAIRRAVASTVTIRISYTPIQREEISATGSGFVVSSDGYIVTVAHLFEDFRNVLNKNGVHYEVFLSDCKKYIAVLISKVAQRGFTPETAVLKIIDPPNDLTSILIGDSDDLHVGERVLAIGSPGASNNTIMPGDVIKVHTFLEQRGLIPMIYANTPIVLGASGGVLVNHFGRAVGLTSGCIGVGGVTTSFVCVKDGYFVPINLVMKFARPLIAK